jgi:hypothetical protein
MTALHLDRDGAQRIIGMADEPAMQALEAILSRQKAGAAGQRLFDVPGLSTFLQTPSPVGEIAAAVLGDRTRPVRAILFDKTAETNWSLAWHQDRVVAVRERVDVPGFGPWSRKDGILHVAPPFEVLRRMLTVRLNLDEVPADNAPLLIAPGSHQLGRIAEADVPSVVSRCGSVACVAGRGDG